MNLPPESVRPAYGQRCFSDLPGLFARLLTGAGESPLAALADPLAARYDAVIFLLLDGLGWRYQEQLGGHSLYRRARREGALLQLTAQFPSTTAAHVTVLHTGLTPGQSGVFEWQYYEPALDAVIAPLLFSYAGTTVRDTLKRTKIDPRLLYPQTNLYPALDAAGVRSFIFQHRAYTPSTYSDIVFAGAQAHPYRTLPEGLANLAALVAKQDAPCYCVLYYDEIDALAHTYGPASPQTLAQAEMALTAIETTLLSHLPQGRRILVLVSADHGQMEIHPRTTVYVNETPWFAQLRPLLRADARGRLLPPGGSSRDMFLYVRPEHIGEAQALLAQGLAGRAEVVRTADLIEAGYFGPQVSPAFLARVSELVILPHATESVWWHEKNRFAQRYYGQHGGLSPQEMYIPLAVLPLT